MYHRIGQLPAAAVSVLLIAAVMLPAGCVRRRMTVRTNPSGAQVYVDNYPIGKSPVSTSFTYYGTREIRLVRDGYETLTTKQRVYPPWYELPVLEFVSENLWPGELRDERVLDFQMVPQRIMPTDQLIGRGENLRHSSQVGYISPMPLAGLGSVETPSRQPAPDPRITMPSSPPQPLPQFAPPPAGRPLAPESLPPPVRLPAPDAAPSWAP